MKWLLAVVAISIPFGLIADACGSDDDPPTTPASGGSGGGSAAEIETCPDYLEVAGPYRVGIDPEYRASMDWDGDGVSCE
jgi:Excalibur calcium-binding domain